MTQKAEQGSDSRARDRRAYGIFSKLMIGGAAVVVVLAILSFGFHLSGNALSGAARVGATCGLAVGWLSGVIGSIRLMDIMPRLIGEAKNEERPSSAHIKGVYIRTSLGVTILAAATVAVAL